MLLSNSFICYTEHRALTFEKEKIMQHNAFDVVTVCHSEGRKEAL